MKVVTWTVTSIKHLWKTFLDVTTSRESRRISCINLLKPTGHVMHQEFNIQQLYVLPTHCIYVFCIYLRTNKRLVPLTA
jgi:hypothetical protein